METKLLKNLDCPANIQAESNCSSGAALSGAPLGGNLAVGAATSCSRAIAVTYFSLVSRDTLSVQQDKVADPRYLRLSRGISEVSKQITHVWAVKDDIGVEILRPLPTSAAAETLVEPHAKGISNPPGWLLIPAHLASGPFSEDAIQGQLPEFFWALTVPHFGRK